MIRIKTYIQEVFNHFDNDDAKRSLAIHFFTYIGIFSLIVFGINGIIDRNYTYTFIIFGFLAVTVGLLFYLKYSQNISVAAHLIVSLLFIFNLIIFAELAQNGTGLFWFYIFPLIAIFMLGHKTGSIYALILVTIIALQIKYQFIETSNTYNTNIISRFVFTYFVVVILTNIFEYMRVISVRNFLKMYQEKTELLKQSDAQKEQIAALADEETAINEELKQQNEEMLTINNEIEKKQRLIEKQNEELSKTLDIVTRQQEKITDINSDLRAGIQYAKTIQDALLPNEQEVAKYFSDFFILSRPKLAVSGDFYYINKVDDWIIFAVADCTGHGVPGGFLTMLGITYLHGIMSRQEAETTGEALNVLREKFKAVFSHFGNDNPNGMDIALCAVNEKTHELQYSGAYNPLIIIRDNEITEYKANRYPIGIYPIEDPFDTQRIQLRHNDLIYIFSDGFYDQPGGEKRKRFSKKRFKEVLLVLQNYPFTEQKEILDNILKSWRGRFEQVDDITVMGIKYQIQ